MPPTEFESEGHCANWFYQKRKQKWQKSDIIQEITGGEGQRHTCIAIKKIVVSLSNASRLNCFVKMIKKTYLSLIVGYF